jgi:hypothetical protein
MTINDQNYTPRERNDASGKHEDNLSRSSLACLKDAYASHQVDFRSRPHGNICLRPTDKQLDISPLQYPGGDADNHRVVSDQKNRHEDKIKAVFEMARSGAKQISFENDPHKYDVEIEAVSNSNRKMVHLYTQGADGKQHVVMRGIVNSNGSVEQERDGRGRLVSYEGNGFPQSTPLNEVQRTKPIADPPPKPVLEKKVEQPLRPPEQNPTNDAARFMQNLAQVAEHTLQVGTQTVGWCARGVRQALNKVGFNIDPGRPATELGEYLHKTGQFDKVPLSEIHGAPPKGAILVRNWNKEHVRAYGRNIGHIAIVGHEGREYSDHIAHTKPDGGLYRNSYVLIPKGYSNPDT